MAAAAPRSVCIELLSVLGRKHAPFMLNEDRVFKFSFLIDTTRHSPAAADSEESDSLVAEDDGSRQLVSVAVLIDGHGARPRTTPTPEELLDTDNGRYRTPGEWFVSLVEEELPDIMRRVCQFDPTLLKNLPCKPNEPPPNSVGPDGQQKPLTPDGYLDRLHHYLGHLREIINEHLNSIQSRVCQGAGSTLCMGLHVFNELFCVNVGDSCMIALSERNSDIIAIWETGPIVMPVCPAVPRDLQPLGPLDGQEDYGCHQGFPCSHEDTLVNFPDQVREGQNWNVVNRDYKYVLPNLKPNRRVNTLCAPYSNKNLRMVNTLGNLGHRQVLVPRTTVYRFALPCIGRPFSMLFMTDGIKDMFSVAEIAALHVCKTAGDLLCVIEKMARTPVMQNSFQGQYCRGQYLPPFMSKIQVENALAQNPLSSDVTYLVQNNLRLSLERYGRLYAPSKVLDEISTDAIDRLVEIFTGDVNGSTHAMEDDRYRSISDISTTHKITQSQRCCAAMVYVSRLKGAPDDVSCIVWRIE